MLFEPMGITGVEWIRVKGDTDAGGIMWRDRHQRADYPETLTTGYGTQRQNAGVISVGPEMLWVKRE
jgi:hypothetical protein